MARVTVYLPDELAEKLKQLPVQPNYSRILREQLEKLLVEVTRAAEIIEGIKAWQDSKD